jgi:chemotaxis protein CheC
MSAPLLAEEQRDALQEIANIGMGRAGASIARIFNEFVELSIPRILTPSGAEIPETIARMVGGEPVSAVRQGFHGQLRGEVVVLYDHRGCNELAELFGYEPDLDDCSEKELLLDVTNTLVGACLGGVAEQLKLTIGFSAPSLLGQHASAVQLFRSENLIVEKALFVEVNFKLEQRSFACHLIILMPNEEIAGIVRAVDAFIQSFC